MSEFLDGILYSMLAMFCGSIDGFFISQGNAMFELGIEHCKLVNNIIITETPLDDDNKRFFEQIDLLCTQRGSTKHIRHLALLVNKGSQCNKHTKHTS